eukprot:jgi/Galph1/2656/GphlegSOOS_G1316.1
MQNNRKFRSQLQSSPQVDILFCHHNTAITRPSGYCSYSLFREKAAQKLRVVERWRPKRQYCTGHFYCCSRRNENFESSSVDFIGFRNIFGKLFFKAVNFVDRDKEPLIEKAKDKNVAPQSGEAEDRNSSVLLGDAVAANKQESSLVEMVLEQVHPVLKSKTLHAVSLALNNSRRNRKHVDTVLPYDVQRVLFDTVCDKTLSEKSSETNSVVGKEVVEPLHKYRSVGFVPVTEKTSSKKTHDSSVSGSAKVETQNLIAKKIIKGKQPSDSLTENKAVRSASEDVNEVVSEHNDSIVQRTKDKALSPSNDDSNDKNKQTFLNAPVHWFETVALFWSRVANSEKKADNKDLNVAEREQSGKELKYSMIDKKPKEGVAQQIVASDMKQVEDKKEAKQPDMMDLIKSANDARTKEEAMKFDNSEKLNVLVNALNDDFSGIQADAATALANLAAILPSLRRKIVELNNDQVLHISKSIICEGATRSMLRFRWKKPYYYSSLHHSGKQLETKMSILHLIGSLALCGDIEGRRWRKQISEDREFVAALKRFSRGANGGYPEGVARFCELLDIKIGVNIWNPRIPGQKGIRVLSFDGGGTRAIMTFEILKYLKRITGCEIHELFDVIGGTSTGGIIAVTLGLRKRPIEEVEALYRELIGKIFTKNPVNAPKLLITRAYYDASILEGILKREAGRSLFIDSTTEEKSNKVFVVSSVVSRKPHVMHLFRNYTFPEGKESRYEGSVETQLWEGLRASSAAPTYFSEMRINGELYADGALVANNPTGVAIHEAKKLFPGVPIELVASRVSIGTGRITSPDLPEATRRKESSLGWNDIITYLVNSATSTESIHESLEDLLPPEKYFRLNPTTDTMDIDEVRPGKLAMMTELAHEYIRENTERLELLGELLRPKPARRLHEILFDIFRVKAFMWILSIKLGTIACFVLVYFRKKKLKPLYLASASSVYTFIDPREPMKQYPFPSIFSEPEKSLTLVVPAYNEENRLPKMLEEAIRCLELRTKRDINFTWEIIVVDDGSRDGTVEAAYKSGDRLGVDKFRVLRLPKNCGKGEAVKNGMLSGRGELLLMADADGATRFEDYILLEKAIGTDDSGKARIAIGSRAHIEQVERSFIRKLFMLGFHWFVFLVGGVKQIRDTQCGFKMFTREAGRLVFPNQHLQRWAFDVELMYLAQQYSILVLEVPVKWTEIPGSKLNILKAVINMSRDLLKMRLYYTLGIWPLYNYRDVNTFTVSDSRDTRRLSKKNEKVLF